MPQKNAESVHILEGDAILYRREGTPCWQVRFKVYGRWLRASTKQKQLDKAKKSAVQIVTKAWHRQEDGLPVVSKRFKAVANLAIQRMDEYRQVNRGKETYKTYVQAINRYLIPFFGNYNVDRINAALMHEFAKWRIVEMNKIPSASVINNHNSALNRVFDEAVERGFMAKIMIPPLRNDGIKTQKRPTITIEEYTHLHRGLRDWVEDGRKGNESHLRNVLRDYILILAHTGIRAGTEAMNLKWRDVYFFTKNKVEYLGMKVNGKTGERHVTIRHAAIRYLDRLRQLNPEWAQLSFESFIKKKIDAYVFRVDGKNRSGKIIHKDMTTAFGRMFTRYLERRGLLLDKVTGKPRSLYSLRHMYAVFALTYNRMSIYTLAEHMGTSVPMIERHYGQIILQDKASEIAGDKEYFIEKAKREEQARLRKEKEKAASLKADDLN